MNSSLVKIKEADALLSDNQITFNNLNQKISKIQADMLSEKEKLYVLLKQHNKVLMPINNELKDAYFNLAKVIAENYETLKFNKNKSEIITAAIVTICETAFSFGSPKADEQDFFNFWSIENTESEEKDETDDSDEAEFVAERINGLKRKLVKEMHDKYDVYLDTEDYGQTETEFKRMMLDAERLKGTQGDFYKNKKVQKKSKKQFEKEQLEAKNEATKGKTIRSIYLSLAKVLHPDMETDEDKKLEKTELIKKVIAAYEANELSTLLMLELEWITNEKNNLSKLSDEKLKIYNEVLKKQIEQLESQFIKQRFDALYREVSKLVHLSTNNIQKHFTDTLEKYKFTITSLNHLSKEFKFNTKKSDLLDLAKGILNQ